MADEVDYESDTAMAVEEEDDERDTRRSAASSSSGRRVTTVKAAASSDSGRRVVKGRGKGAAAMDSERYGDSSGGVFEKLRTRTSRADDSSALQSVEGWILFVSGVHEEAQEEDILDAFGEDAPVKNLHMNLDRRTGFVKGYALVEFAEFAAAKDAMDRMDGQELLGSTIHVDWAFRQGAAPSNVQCLPIAVVYRVLTHMSDSVCVSVTQSPRMRDAMGTAAAQVDDRQTDEVLKHETTGDTSDASVYRDARESSVSSGRSLLLSDRVDARVAHFLRASARLLDLVLVLLHVLLLELALRPEPRDDAALYGAHGKVLVRGKVEHVDAKVVVHRRREL